MEKTTERIGQVKSGTANGTVVGIKDKSLTVGHVLGKTIDGRKEVEGRGTLSAIADGVVCGAVGNGPIGTRVVDQEESLSALETSVGVLGVHLTSSDVLGDANAGTEVESGVTLGAEEAGGVHLETLGKPLSASVVNQEPAETTLDAHVLVDLVSVAVGNVLGETHAIAHEEAGITDDAGSVQVVVLAVLGHVGDARAVNDDVSGFAKDTEVDAFAVLETIRDVPGDADSAQKNEALDAPLADVSV